MDEREAGNYGNTTEYGTSKGLFGETDRESGEYHFRSGHTQQVYSNAHYIPLDESASTPKYYRPADKSSTHTAEKKKADRNKANTGMAIIFLLCFLFGILGGVLGALGMNYFTDARGELSSEPEEAAENVMPEAEDRAFYEEAAVKDSDSNDKLSASEIYNLACEEAVSISVEMVSYDRFGNQIPSTVSGSGFLISEDGYILTNYHVVEEAVMGGFHVTVTAFDGSVYIGRIAGADEDADIAVIKIENDSKRHVTFGNSEEISVGDEIYIVGNPYGILEFSMTAGHISGLNREIATEENENALNMFQVDAAVYAGNSGGPVYTPDGKVIGIITAKYSTSGMEGIGFALPINDVLPIVNELIEKGYVSGKASLGVSFDSRYNTVYSRYYRLPDGAFVSSVDEGSCAEKAGIRQGDILMQIGEYGITEYSDIAAVLRHFSAGESTEIRLYRDGQILTVTVSFDEAIPAALMNIFLDENRT